MKHKKKLMIISFVLVGMVTGVITTSMLLPSNNKVLAQENASLTSLIETHQEHLAVNVVAEIEEQKVLARQAMIVYDGLTLDELSTKLDRLLKSTLAGTGNLFATYSLEAGVDPYIAVAIALEETGCNSGTCSRLTRDCNNVGGMKGSPRCGSGSYMAFNSITEGIQSFISNLSRNYFAKGLTTPELINTRYASSSTWASKVNRYVEKIRAS